MIKKVLLNFIMIQTTFMLMSLSLGYSWGPFTSTGIPMAMGFFFVIFFLYSFIPSLIVATTFAFIQKRFYEKQ